ncbi:MAG: efflux RND transporter permease subunit [Planctomycetes bacterium]|nr:efflux RND transporter permease subunit [Planctomycetota bacterium]
MSAQNEHAGGIPERRGFYEFTVIRPVAITMVAITVLVFGWASLKKLRLNLLPDISYPTITVRTQYRGAAPEDVEERVSEKLQEALATTPNLVRIWSVSRAEVSDIVLEFTWGTRVTFAMQDVREKLDRVFLPPDAEKPILLRYDPNLDPILRIGVSGEPNLRRLRRMARDDLKREMEGLPGVAAVRLRGGLEDEVRVAVNTQEISKRNISLELVARRLREENLNSALGKLEEGDTEFLVRALNQFRTVEDISNVVLTSVGGADVRLKEVASIEPYYRDRDVIVRIDGAETVELDIFREADANIVELAERVKDRIFGSSEQQKFISDMESGELDKKYKKEDATFAEIDSPTKKQTEEHDAAVRKRKADKDANTSFLARKIDPKLKLTILSDQSRFIKDALEDVNNSGMIGGVLAVLIIYLYLRRVSETSIIGLSIPISVLATFAPMYLMKVSLNVMSLGGLALGIGMIVDDAIVVLESISRCHDEGDSRVRAAVRGVSEVAGAVTASTLTAIAVFFPIVFVEGIAGQLFGDQALTVVVSRLISLIFALFFIPMLASRSMKDAGARSSLFANPAAGLSWKWTQWPSNLLIVPGRIVLAALTASTRISILIMGGAWWVFLKLFFPFQYIFNVATHAIERAYPRVLRAALRAPWIVIAAAVILMIWAGSRATSLGSQLLPDVHQGEFSAEVHLNVGTPVEKTDAFLQPFAAEISKFNDIEQVILASGVERDALTSTDEGDHTGKITVRIKSGDNIPAREEAVIERVRQFLSQRPEIRQVRFKKPTLFSLSTPVEIEIRGRDLGILANLSSEVEKVLASEPTLGDVRSTLRRGNPEVAVRFRRDEMLRYGFDGSNIATLLRGAVLGDVATTFIEGDQRIDIRVRASQIEVSGLGKLGEFIINPGQATPIPLKAIASLEVREGPAEIRRIGNTRAAIVTANSTGLDLGGLSERLAGKLASIPRPAGYDVEFGGQKKEMDRALQSMVFALLLALFLVYIVMAAQFESVAQPLVILVTVPLSIVGLVPTLELTKTSLSVVALLGAILLGGIVVANAIVLLDRANQNRAKGMGETEALVNAGSVRLRPILMTALATILGLLPMTGWLHFIPIIGKLGSGEGAELRAPMAIVVVAGLASSTVLTLVVIPVIDSAVYKLLHRGARA